VSDNNPIRDKLIRAVIEKWHPGSMGASFAVNGKIIVPPQTLFDAQGAVDAALDTWKSPSDEFVWLCVDALSVAQLQFGDDREKAMRYLLSYMTRAGDTS
jgi:hypothetical protein